MESVLDALECAEPPGREPLSPDSLRRLDSACRARSRGRMTPEQEARFGRVARSYTTSVLDALRAGRPVPNGVRARFERPRPAPWQRLTLAGSARLIALLGVGLAAGRAAPALGVLVAWVGGLSLAFVSTMAAPERDLLGRPMGPVEWLRVLAMAAYAVTAYSACVGGMGELAFALVAWACSLVAGEAASFVAGCVAGAITVSYMLFRTLRWLLSR